MNTRTLALFTAAAACAVALHAQETVVTATAAPVVVPAEAATTTSTTVTNTAGTIQEFTPGSSRIVVRSTTGAPVTYTYSKRTTFVDAAGNVVAAETIRTGEPTTVYYAMEAGQPVVSKVVVTRAAAAAAPVTHIQRTETTTTSTTKK